MTVSPGWTPQNSRLAAGCRQGSRALFAAERCAPLISAVSAGSESVVGGGSALGALAKGLSCAFAAKAAADARPVKTASRRLIMAGSLGRPVRRFQATNRARAGLEP